MFLIAGAIRLGVKAAKDGMAAHRDAQSPEAASERPVELDRWGNPKQRGMVYDMVFKAETKGKGRAVAGSSAGAGGAVDRCVLQAPQEYAPQRRGSTEKKGLREGGGEDYGPQDWDAKRQVSVAMPLSLLRVRTARGRTLTLSTRRHPHRRTTKQ